MITKRSNYLPGEWVEVRELSEILATLDDNGTLDGLPFMPEMSVYCGQRFKVIRRAEKSCVEVGTLSYGIRELIKNDVYFLDELRCDGTGHDNCGRACLLFWKAAWLREDRGPRNEVASRPATQSLHLKTKTDAKHYFCQSTQLKSITKPLRGAAILRKCFEEVFSRNRGPLEMVRLIAIPLWRKVTYWYPRPKLKGNLKKTPNGALNLNVGELVTILPAEEISKTLDENGKNRGLFVDYGMCKFSGGTFKVRNRVDRMIMEPTGEMREVGGTVALEGPQCFCWNVVGGCSRRELMYWREIWLRRANEATPAPTETTPENNEVTI